jgi:hypothetical protein
MIFIVQLSDLQEKIPQLVPIILQQILKENEEYFIADFAIIYSLGLAMSLFPVEMKYKYLQINK